jgi:hypothetical protein
LADAPRPQGCLTPLILESVADAPQPQGCLTPLILGRLSRYSEGWQFDGARFYHAFLGVVIFLILLLKISFVCFYQTYRPSAKLLGLFISVGTVVTWLIAGAFWLAMMGGRSLN